MKITILEKQPGEEDEIIVKCDYIDENISRLLNQFKTGSKSKLNFLQRFKNCFARTKRHSLF